MRKQYLDNIKTIAILLLFPYHTFMIWNNFGTKFYIWGGENDFLSSLIVLVSPWLMPVLFVIAGISARYSLAKRTTKEFIKERIWKLLLPFLSGLLFLVPFQTLYARKFFFDYHGGILENFKYFFTHFSDFNGYDGMFTLGHLWFLFYLFLISILTFPLLRKQVSKKWGSKINLISMILLFIPIFLVYPIGNFGGQSVGKYLLLYLIGYYLFQDSVVEKLISGKFFILLLFFVSEAILVVLYFKYRYYGDLLVNFVGWLGVLSCIILGRLFLNKENRITHYFKNASFSIYLLHQTILIFIGYYSLRFINHLILQIFIILCTSFLVTILSGKSKILVDLSFSCYNYT